MMDGWPRSIEAYTRLWLRSVGLEDGDPAAQAIWAMKRGEASYAAKLPTVDDMWRRRGR